MILHTRLAQHLQGLLHIPPDDDLLIRRSGISHGAGDGKALENPAAADQRGDIGHRADMDNGDSNSLDLFSDRCAATS